MQNHNNSCAYRKDRNLSNIDILQEHYHQVGNKGKPFNAKQNFKQVCGKYISDNQNMREVPSDESEELNFPHRPIVMQDINSVELVLSLLSKLVEGEQPEQRNYYYNEFLNFLKRNMEQSIQRMEMTAGHNQINLSSMKNTDGIRYLKCTGNSYVINNRNKGKEGYSNSSDISYHHPYTSDSVKINNTVTSDHICCLHSSEHCKGGNRSRNEKEQSAASQIQKNSSITKNKFLNGSCYNSVQVLSVSGDVNANNSDFSADNPDCSSNNSALPVVNNTKVTNKKINEDSNYILENWTVIKDGKCLFLSGKLIDMDTEETIKDKFISKNIVSRPKKNIVRTDDGLYHLRGNFQPRKDIPLNIKEYFIKGGFPLKWKMLSELWEKIEKDEKKADISKRRMRENSLNVNEEFKFKDENISKKTNLVRNGKTLPENKKKRVAPLKSKEENVKPKDKNKRKKSPIETHVINKKKKTDKSIEKDDEVAESVSGLFGVLHTTTAMVHTPGSAINSAVKMLQEMAGTATPPTPMLNCYMGSKGNSPKSNDKLDYEDKEEKKHVTKRMAKANNQKLLPSMQKLLLKKRHPKR